ncbi:MAG TPA: alpha/beta hydrolase [Puia sp.]|nr:alpha/beta hydrolase [Puia sp.]
MSRSIFRRTVVLIAGWLILLGVLSIRGFFADFSKLPPRLTFALLPPLLVVLLFTRSQTGKRVLQQIQPQWLIYLQSFRILVEIVLWLLVRKGLLPVQLSFEGRNFDIVTGLLAFPVGYYCFVKKTWPSTIALLFNIGGLFMLLNAITISTLSMPTPLRVFQNQPDSSLLTKFPLIYLPGLLVPLAYTLHILSLQQWRISRRSVVRAVISAKEWFGSGGRLPYDIATKSIVDPDKAMLLKSLFVFQKYVAYSKQNPARAITFLPGFPSGSYDWAQIDALIEAKDPLNRLYVEYIGQGDSDKPEQYPYSTFERADVVEAIWKHHHIESTFVVTFDYSSLVVMELLRRQQEKAENGIKPSTIITKVLFINGGYFTDGHSHPLLTTPLLKTGFGKRGTIKAQESDFAFNGMIKGMWSKKYRVTEAELAEVRDAIRRRNGTLFLHYAAGFVDEHKENGGRLDLLPIVERMHKDVFFYIVGSDKDQFEPKQIKLAKERISKYGVPIQVLPGGHMITMEQPQLLTAMILVIAK